MREVDGYEIRNAWEDAGIGSPCLALPLAGSGPTSFPIPLQHLASDYNEKQTLEAFQT